MSTLRRICIILGMTFLAACVWFGIAWTNFLNSSTITDSQGAKYKVRLGASFKTVSSELYQQNLIQHPLFFNLLFRLRQDVHHLKAGEYLFPQGAKPGAMIDQIVTGKGLVYHSFIIVPGMTFKQIRHNLDQNLELQHITQKWTDADIMKRLGNPGLNPEGQFYPDTYYYVDESPDFVLLKRAFHMMSLKLKKAWETRAPDNYFKTPYEALIAASIIEKEARVHAELPVMAGVMINRLKTDMPLQFDPTVIYGIGDRYDGKIYKWDLTDENPYNTYIHKGLPPSPISMPGKEAINAVMHPDQNDYFYFVAHGDHMTHQFSHTLNEHYAAVNAAHELSPDFFNTDLARKYLMKSLSQDQTLFHSRDVLRVQ